MTRSFLGDLDAPEKYWLFLSRNSLSLGFSLGNNTTRVMVACPEVHLYWCLIPGDVHIDHT